MLAQRGLCIKLRIAKQECTSIKKNHPLPLKGWFFSHSRNILFFMRTFEIINQGRKYMKYIKEIKKELPWGKKKVLHRNSRIICYLQVSRLACIFSAFLEVQIKVFIMVTRWSSTVFSTGWMTQIESLISPTHSSWEVAKIELGLPRIKWKSFL